MRDRLGGSILRRAWPSGAIDHLLRAALLADADAAAAGWRAFEGAADFDHLTGGELRLIALVAKRLEVLAPASPMRARMGGVERAHWSRSQMILAEAGDALRALEAAHVSALAIKGGAVAGISTRGLALEAVDVVVRPDDFATALDMLTRAGWRPEGSGSTGRPDTTSIRLDRGRVGRLALRRSAFRPAYASEADDAAIWQRSAPGEIACAVVRVPSATDAVAIALSDGFPDVRRRGDCVADVTAGIDRGVDWELFAAIARRRGLEVPGALVLRYVRERLERPVPETLLRALDGRIVHHPRQVLAAFPGLRTWRRRLGVAIGRDDRRAARYHLRRSAAALVRLVRPFAPARQALDELADRLSFVRSAYGPYLLNTPGDRTFELCVRGYGGFVAGAIASQDRPFVFLDIGANLGLFSLLAARNPSCQRVIAIEPLPSAFRSLEANIERNGAIGIERIRGAVVTTQDAEAGLSFDPRHSGMSRVVPVRDGVVHAPVISTETLDGLLPEPAGAVVAKIDVEGSEIDVLSTLRRTRFYHAISEIIIEVSERNLGAARRRRLLELLAEDGYREVSRSGAPDHYDARYTRASRARPLTG